MPPGGAPGLISGATSPLGAASSSAGRSGAKALGPAREPAATASTVESASATATIVDRAPAPSRFGEGALGMAGLATGGALRHRCALRPEGIRNRHHGQPAVRAERGCIDGEPAVRAGRRGGRDGRRLLHERTVYESANE